MSDSASPESTPETTTPPSPTAPPAGASEWRAGQHSQFAGRSAEEILGIAEGQRLALEQQAAVLQRFNQPTHTEPRNRFDLDVQDDEYLTGRQVKGLFQQLANQPAPVDQTARNLAAQGLYTNIRAARADEFKRWGSEIDNEIRRLDVSYWTYDALNTIVNMVRANHVDELVAEKAQRLANEAHPTIRSGSGGSGGGPLTQQRTLDSDTLPKSWVDKARLLGIDETTVREFAQIAGTTPDEYLADVEKYGKNGAVIRG
jgi:hypothetical protein